MIIKVKCILLSWLLLTCIQLVQAQTPGKLEATHPRAGFPNFLEKIRNGGEMRVAYIGGSITEAQDGWRDLTFSWLRSNYPMATFRQINATIGGTGSDLGVFRMDKDVLSQNPDLVFVEFAVNDFGLTDSTIYKTMEGIVRKTWKANPQTDICFVYTLAENVVETMRQGSYQHTAVAMEKIAGHYGIPSVHMGVEVIRLLEAGKLIFTGKPEEHPGKIVFTQDKTHPLSLSGHPVYAHSVIEFLKDLEKTGKPAPHKLPAPFVKDNWESAKMIPLSELETKAGWEPLAADDELNRKFSKFMPTLSKATPPDAFFKVRFKGSVLGIYDIIGPKTGVIEVTADNQPATEIYRFDQWCDNYRKHSFFVKNLGDGKHEVTFRVPGKKFDKTAILAKRNINVNNPADYDGYGWFVNALLLVGDLL
jgi:hypothetical protein